MSTLHFIGRRGAATDQVVRWCRERWPESLPPGLVFCVPTSLALRRLRDALIEAYTQFQGVRFLTPSALTTLFAPPAATRPATPAEMLSVWSEVFAWLRDADPDDAILASLFPSERAWLDRPAARYTLARRLMALRDTLAERCLDFTGVANHPASAALSERERNRWLALDLLETKCRELLREHGDLQDPADLQLAILRDPVPQPQEAAETWRLIVACVPDLMPALTGLFDAAPACDILVLAEPNEAERFDEHGLPLPDFWCRAPIDLPDAAIRPAETPQGEADRVNAFLDEHRHINPEDLCLCALDREAMQPLSGHLSAHGVTIFEPEPIALSKQPAARALLALIGLLGDPTPEALLPLLSIPEVAQTVRASVARLRIAYDDLLANHCPATRRDAFTFCQEGPFRDFLAKCNAWSDAFRADPVAAARGFLSDLYGKRTIDPVRDPIAFATFDALRALLNELAGLRTGKPDPDLFAARLADVSLRPVRADADCSYEGRLEILWSRAPILTILGLNEGLFPDTTFEDAFLPNAFRRALGLRSDVTRTARDAYLLATATAWRAPENLLLTCARTNLRGDWLKPTRLFFRCSPEVRAERARALFLGSTPRPPAPRHESALTFDLNPAEWDTPPLPERLSHTAIAEFLKSPLLYWLTCRLGLADAEPPADGVEAAAFGILIHKALEILPKTSSAVIDDLTDALLGAYDAAFTKQYGSTPSVELMAIRESALRRLRSAARIESQSRLEGWETILTECNWERSITVQDHTLILHGRIDRVDRNRHTGAIRILDYKTGQKGTSPDDTHYHRSRNGELRWMSFQLPIYRLLARKALNLAGDTPIALSYFTLPAMNSAAIQVYADPESEAATDAALFDTIARILTLGHEPLPADAGPYADGAPSLQFLLQALTPTCD